VFGRVDAARDAENFLRGGDGSVVDPAGFKNVETRPMPCAGKQRESRAAGAAMQVQAELGGKSAKRPGRGWKNLRHIRISFEYSSETGFRHDGNSQIRPVLFQQVEGRCGEDTIAQRAKAYDGHPASGAEAGNGVGLEHEGYLRDLFGTIRQ
jgi:hypothetical protein